MLSVRVGTFEIMPLRCFPRTETGNVRRQQTEAMFRRRSPGDGLAAGSG